jgi:hypothetical protein
MTDQDDRDDPTRKGSDEPDARETGAAEDQPLPGPPAAPDPEPSSADSSPDPDGE